MPNYRKLHTGEYIAKNRKSQVFNEAYACLNHTNLTESDSLNCRAFEIAGAGGLQIIEYKPCLPEYFEPNSEVLVYSDLDTLQSYWSQLCINPRAFDHVRKAGMKRAINQHTYKHRLEELLSYL